MNVRFFSLRKREKEVFDFIDKQLSLTIEAVNHLNTSLRYLKMLDFEAFKRNYSEIDCLEKKADDIHRKIVEEICKGAFFGGIREDLLNMLEKVDNIADSAKDSAKILLLRKPEDKIINYIFANDDLMDFFSNCFMAVKELKDVINGLEKGKNFAFEHISTVEEYEEKADELKARVLNRIFEKAEEFNLVSVMQFKDFINIADNIADNAEDASDIVLILIAKGYS
jgi:predicted phosphate transport protein (TIGR00153 family)